MKSSNPPTLTSSINTHTLDNRNSNRKSVNTSTFNSQGLTQYELTKRKIMKLIEERERKAIRSVSKKQSIETSSNNGKILQNSGKEMLASTH